MYVVNFAKVSRGSEEDRKLYTAADVGFIAENVYLYCASQGLSTVVRASLDRECLAVVLRLTKDQKVILAQTVGYSKK